MPISDGEDEEADDDEEQKIQEEPLSELVERLDATVFGLIEALDADRADLPKLLDEALKGSFWARQIVREGDGVEELHRMVFEARANLIWSTTTPQARKGHFAMSVGLEAGLTIDAMAEELGELLDRADAAALPGEIDELADCARGTCGAATGHAALHPGQDERGTGKLAAPFLSNGCRERK